MAQDEALPVEYECHQNLRPKMFPMLGTLTSAATKARPECTLSASRQTVRHRKQISPSDPASAWTAKANKRVQFGYGLNYLIDVALP